MDKHFVSSSAVEVDTYSGEWTHIEGSEIDHNEDRPKPASTGKHAPSEVEGDFCLIHPPHPSEGSDEVTPKPNNQPSFFGGIWSSVSTFGSQLIGESDKSTLPPIDEHTQQNMASKDADEQRPRTGRRLLGRIKNAWKSEDDTKDVLETVLNDNDELRKSNTRLLKKLADQEKKIKSCNTELQKKSNEVQRTKLLLKQGSKLQTLPTVLHEPLQDREKDSLVTEIARVEEESRTLRDSLDLVTKERSIFEKDNIVLRKRIHECEVDYKVEKDDNDRLKDEIGQLQKQLEHLSIVESTGTDPSIHEDIVKTKGGAVSCLEARSKQLFENVTKLQEHAKSQSRQILVLQKQADKAQDAEEQVHSLEDLLQGAEEERDQLQKELTHVTAQVNEPDPAEKHRGVTTRRSTPSLPNQVSVLELQKKNTQLMSENTKLEELIHSMTKGKLSLKDLWEKEKTIRDLTTTNQSMWTQVQSVRREKEDLQSQFETIQLQMQSYKSDFEDERKDREAAHSKMADMQKELMKSKNLSEHEKAAYVHEIQSLKEESKTMKEVLQDKDEKLKVATIELNKHKDILADLEVVHQKYVQETNKLENEHERHVLEMKRLESELHAKGIQVKQYAKERETLKKQLATAMSNITVIAEEMEKDRQKAFELQDRLEKVAKVPVKSTKGKKKWRKPSVPDRSEAVEKRVAKLEQLYNDSVQEIQDLIERNEELENIIVTYGLQHKKGKESSTAGMRVVVHECGQTASSSSVHDKHIAMQLLPPDSTVDDSGTARTGNFIGSIPNQQQQSPRNQAVDHASNRESSRASSEQPATRYACDTRSSAGIILPLNLNKESTNPARGSRSVGNTPSTPHKAWSPGHKGKASPTVQSSSAKASGDLVSPVKQDGHAVQSKTSVLNPSDGSDDDTHSTIKSAPLPRMGGKDDTGAKQITKDKHLSSFQAEQATEGSQVPHQHELFVAQLDSSAESTLPINAHSPTLLPKQTTSPTVDDPSQTKGDDIMHIQSKIQPPSLGRDIRVEAHASSSSASAPLEPPAEPTTRQSHSSAPQNLQLKDIQSGSMQQSKKEEVEQMVASVNQFENPLQKRLDDEIHESAVEVIQEVSGGLEEVPQSSNRPYDPNLVCPMCMRRFRIGEIQFFKRHVNTCDGTDEEPTSFNTEDGDLV